MKQYITIILLILSTVYSFSQINNEHIEVGDLAPVITGVDQFGAMINSTDILKNKKILLIFYRGNWCPYCRKHLASLQENLEELSKKGVSVVVVTPEKVKKTKETTKKIKATFSIIHDVDNTIMNAYKVAFKVNEENITSYFGFTQRKIAEYNKKDNTVLPVPATYIIDKNGKISYVHYDPNYHKRSNFKEILKKL